MIGNWYYDNVSSALRIPLLLVALFILSVMGGVIGIVIFGPIGNIIGRLIGIGVFGMLFYQGK